MAHAGTPTDLAKQPAASSSACGSRFLTAVVILAIGFALAMATSFIISNRAASGPAVDRGYDAIEAQRGTALSGADCDAARDREGCGRQGPAMSGVAADTSYNAIENLRAQSGVTVDTSYDAVEKLARGRRHCRTAPRSRPAPCPASCRSTARPVEPTASCRNVATTEEGRIDDPALFPCPVISARSR